MKSRYNSHCVNCGGRIRIGDEITKVNAKWVHEICPDEDNKFKGHKYGVNEPLPIERNPIINFDDLATAIETSISVCNYCNHSLKDNSHGVDQNDFDGTIYRGKCTYCKECHSKKEFVPSKYQQAIFDFVANGTGHGVVEAVAGSGKTTTIVKALDLTPSDAKVGFVAFNKHIATELKKRAPEHVYVSTLHSLGLKVIKNNYPQVKIEEDKVGLILDNEGKITKAERKDNYAKRLSMRKLVSICKSTLIDVEDGNQVQMVIDRYGIEIDSQFQDELINKLPEIMKLCKENIEIVDFDDMIWLPLVLDMKLEKFDFLMVDEAQDINKSQTDFILKSIADTGRVIAVGDRRQSLYGFRGADTEAIPNIIKSLNATVLPLSVTYRCPSSHVELARQIVTQLEARDNAPVGFIGDVQYLDLTKQLQHGDMVICRTNAPLVQPAFECIRMGKKAIIRGKDIGQSLINLIKRFETDDLEQFEVALFEYFHFEHTKLMDKGKEMQAMLLEDRVSTLHFIMKECKTVSELMSRIMMLFGDSQTGIVFSSVHRAKGLEADNVFILRKDLMPHPRSKQEWEKAQEENGKYVAFTRSKNNLYFVVGGENI